MTGGRVAKTSTVSYLLCFYELPPRIHLKCEAQSMQESVGLCMRKL